MLKGHCTFSQTPSTLAHSKHIGKHIETNKLGDEHLQYLYGDVLLQNLVIDILHQYVKISEFFHKKSEKLIL